MKVSIDTRTLQPGDVFIPVKGKNFDGHKFIAEAKKKGAVKILDVNLGEFAGEYRKKFKIPVVAITGSVGKTTTKDMVASVLAQKYKILKNDQNLNNEIGLPLTVLKLEPDIEAAVVEMAMRGSGEIKYLAEIAAPAVGIITNIGMSHIETLKTRQNIAKAKSELIEVMAKKFQPVAGLKKPVVILNVSDDFYKTLKKEAGKSGVTVKSFGIQAKAQFSAEKIIPASGSIKFILKTPAGKISVNLPYPGEHNIYNALAAAAAAESLGLTLKQIKKGLEKFEPSDKRMEITETSRIKIINDTYNASPDSVRAALKILKEQILAVAQNEPRRIAVLGDMLELGNFSESAHRQIGEFLVETGINVLVTVGKSSFFIGQGALNAGLPGKNIFFFKTNREATEHLKRTLRRGDIILVKGSRGMKMEEIVEGLKVYANN